MPASVTYVRVDDDSAKAANWAEVSNVVLPMSADVVVTPGAALSVAAPGFKYVKSHPAFNPEAIPNIVVPQDSLSDDGIVKHVPLGFDFEFYGNIYNEVNIYSNGLLMFGPAVEDKRTTNFSRGDALGITAIPNNVIAFAWTDWNPKLVVGGVRFETRGEAPNRRWVLQFNNVPESGTGRGLLMMQLVLSETTNSIVIYTNTMNVTNTSHLVTQGIENADGTAAAFDSVTNPINGVVSARVRNMFGLTNDAVKFAPPRPPVVFAPKDISVLTTAPSAGTTESISFNAVGTCDASVDPGMATATGEAAIVSIEGVRSDDATLPLVGRYAKGVTTINWTATDENGVKARASQAVTVVDKENPVVTAPADATADNEPGLPSAMVPTGAASSVDNCHDQKVSSARSDGAAMDAPFMVGVTTVTWTATDGSGNSASAKQSITVRDIEAPKLFTPASFDVPATSMSGAVVNYPVSASDNVAVTSLSCTVPSGSRFPIGQNPVDCTAADAAGHTTKASFVVTVYDAPTQMSNLIQEIRDLGMPSGTTEPLVNQLLTAFSHFSDDTHVSCVKMTDFISMVGKKSGGIPDASVPYMIAEADRIMAVIGCPTRASKSSGR